MHDPDPSSPAQPDDRDGFWVSVAECQANLAVKRAQARALARMDRPVSAILAEIDTLLILLEALVDEMGVPARPTLH